jgi:hypothetical protein
MVIAAVRLVWFSRFSRRALNVNVRGWSLLSGRVKEQTEVARHRSKEVLWIDVFKSVSCSAGGGQDG